MGPASVAPTTNPLRNHTFRRLFTAQLVALVGTGLTTVALGLLALDIAGPRAGAVLGTALAIKMIAYVFVSPIAGVATARLPRRAVLVGSSLVRAAAVLTFPLVSEVWHVYVLVALMQSASAVFTPAFQSTIPDVLEDEETYTKALSFTRLSYDLESLLSPVLAGFALTFMTFNLLFVGTSIGFVAAAMIIVLTPIAIERKKRGTAREALMESVSGMRRFRSSVELRALLAINMVVAAGSSVVLTNTPVLIGEVLGRSDRDIALTLAAYGGGSMVVALSMLRLLRARPERTVMLAAASIVPIVLLLTTLLVRAIESPTGSKLDWSGVLVLWFIAGCATSAMLTPVGRLIRRASSPGDRTSIFAAQFSLSHACFLLTYPIAGWVSAEVSIAAAALTLFVLASIAAALALWLWRPDALEAAAAD